MFEERWLGVDSVQRKLCAGVRRGPSQGPVLILLHGVTRSWRDWEPVVPFLSHQWTIFAIDHRGHGQSDRASRYLVDDYAQDLIEVLEQTVGDPVVLVGHSLGAMVAAIAASRVPERVRGLVLEDPPMQTMGRSIQGTVWQKLFEGMRQVCVAGGSLEQMIQRLGSISLPQADGSTVQLRTLRTEEALRWGASCLSKLDPKVFEPLIAGEWLEGLDWESIPGRIASPAILLQADFGAGGALSDAEAQAFCQGCQECEWVRFPGKNHSLHGTIPGQIATVIDRFLAKPKN